LLAPLQAAAIAVVCVTLTVGAATKVADPGAIRASLSALGVPPGLARLAGAGLPLVELATAALLAAYPASAVSQGVAGALFALFAAGAVWAMARRRAVPCGCFGALRPQARLGTVQLVQLAGVCVLIVALRASPPAWDPIDGALLFDACLLAAAAGLLLGAAGAWRRTRAARISFTQTRLLTRSLALEVEWHE
jgi:hypothetical protein